MYAGFLDEPKLLAYSYDLEQALGARPQPAYLNDVIPEPADAGLCAVPAAATGRSRRKSDARRHFEDPSPVAVGGSSAMVIGRIVRPTRRAAAAAKHPWRGRYARP